MSNARYRWDEIGIQLQGPAELFDGFCVIAHPQIDLTHGVMRVVIFRPELGVPPKGLNRLRISLQIREGVPEHVVRWGKTWSDLNCGAELPLSQVPLLLTVVVGTEDGVGTFAPRQ